MANEVGALLVDVVLELERARADHPALDPRPGLRRDRRRLDDRLVGRLADEVREHADRRLEPEDAPCTGPVADTPAASKNGDRPAFEPLAPTYCFMLATTSAEVIVLPLWNLTPLRIWNVHDGRVRVRLPARREPGHDLALRVREGQVLAGDAGERERAAVVEQVRLERAACRQADADRAARLDRASCARRVRCRTGLADEREQGCPSCRPRGRTSRRDAGTRCGPSRRRPARRSGCSRAGPASLRRYASITLRVSLSIRPSSSVIVARRERCAVRRRRTRIDGAWRRYWCCRSRRVGIASHARASLKE